MVHSVLVHILMADKMMLFQQPVDFDFAAGAEVNVSVYDDRDHKTRWHRGAITLAVLRRGVDGLTEFIGIEGVEDCRLVVGAIPGLGRDGPYDRVLGAVGRDGWRGAGIFKLHS